MVWIIIILFIIILSIYYIKKNKDSNVFNTNIYLDNNATTPMSSKSLKLLTWGTGLGNASSSYAHEAKNIIEKNSQLVKKVLHIPDNIPNNNYLVVYTSGASESNNTILKSVALNNPGKHMILSAYEHKTSLECAQNLEKDGIITLTLIKPNMWGFIEPKEVELAIQPDTILVSIMHVNNEIGTINNLQTIGHLIKQKNPNIIFHSDVVQSFGKLPIFPINWHLDALSMSYHKIYGPVGIGLLVVKNNLLETIKNHPLIFGSQNYEMRGGTLNVAGICGAYGALSDMMQNREQKNNKLITMKNIIINFLIKNFKIANLTDYYKKPDDFRVNYSNPGFEILFIGDRNFKNILTMSPNTLLISIIKYGPDNFCNVKLKKFLEKNNIIISIGSACNSDNSKPSHVIYALDLPYICRCGVIRISLGDENTYSQIQQFCKKLYEGIYQQQ